MARKNTGWLSEDGKVHETRKAADDHDAKVRVQALVVEVLDLEDTVDTVEDVTKLVTALARPEVIADLRRLAPAKPRKPRAVKKEAA